MVFGSWNPKSTICPFRARKWLFQAPKTLHFKGKMANFEAQKTVKQGKNAKRTNGTHFTRVQTFATWGKITVSLYQDHWQKAKTPLPNLPKPSKPKNIFGEKTFWGHEGKTFPIFWVGGATRKKPHVTLQLFFRPT